MNSLSEPTIDVATSSLGQRTPAGAYIGRLSTEAYCMSSSSEWPRRSRRWTMGGQSTRDKVTVSAIFVEKFFVTYYQSLVLF